MGRLRTLLLFLGIHCVASFPRGLLYKHGYGVDEFLPRQDEVSSPEIQLKVPVAFFGELYGTIYVNSNGLLSFQTEIPMFFNIQFPLNYPVIAPLYTNVDIRQHGTISYRESQDPEDLARGTRNVRESFSYTSGFNAKSVFIATWLDVGYHENGSDKLNTYQVAIISDGEDSFVEFIYPDKGIQWIQGTGSESGLPDARAQAGLVSADGVMYTLPGSGTDRVYNLEKKTNMNAPGQWIYQVTEGKVLEPDLYENSDYDEEVNTCTASSTQCHSKAKCVDNEEGFCCICTEHYYGNGKSCIKNDVPIRANGKINGIVNNIQLDNLDLQSYIVMTDGRSYTAISKVPRDIGYTVQTLQILGALMGFVFAKPIGNIKNGYQLSGGIFNHTANIQFDSGERIRIIQRYLGLDVFDQLKLEAEIQGNIPKIPDHEKLDLMDYEEQYTVTKPGVILSQASHNFVYGDDREEVRYTIDQTIEYTPCKFGKTLDPSSWKVKVSKNYISFESKEQILRFGMTEKSMPLGDIDPCKEGRQHCGVDSTCIVEGDSYSCVCNPGFHYIYSEENKARCVDINECQVGLHNCDVNAQCINEPGKFSCRCNPGFEGDGYYCKNTQTCNDISCPENSQCVFDHEAKCQCIPGYIGDGRICVADKKMSCDVINNCSPYAMCSISEISNEYECKCLPGYNGNGYICDPVYAEPKSEEEDSREITTTTVETPTETPSDRYPQSCVLGVCWCPDGYTKEIGTRYCIPKTEVEEQTTLPPEKEDDKTILQMAEPICFERSCACPSGFIYDSKAHICVLSYRFSNDIKRRRKRETVQTPVPFCFNGNCQCPWTFNYDIKKRICVADPSFPHDTKGPSGHEILQAPIPFCFKGKCDCPWTFDYDSEKHTCIADSNFPHDTKGPTGRKPI